SCFNLLQLFEEALMNRRELADRHAMFPRNRSKLEEALLYGLHIVLAFRAKLRRDERTRLFGFDQNALQGRLNRLKALRKVGLTFEPSQHGVELCIGEDGAGQSVGGAFKILPQLCRREDLLPLRGECLFLPGLGCKRVKLVARGSEIVRFTFGKFERLLKIDHGLAALAPFFPKPRNGLHLRHQPAKLVEEMAVRRGVQQSAVVMLPMDFHESAAK